MPIRVCPSRRHRRVSDRRTSNARPYGADRRSPVGAIAESPADMGTCPTGGPSRAPAPTVQTSVPCRGDLWSPADLRVCPTGGPGHGLGAGPYGADPRFPVGAIHESPVDIGACQTDGRAMLVPTAQTSVPRRERSPDRSADMDACQTGERGQAPPQRPGRRCR